MGPGPDVDYLSMSTSGSAYNFYQVTKLQDDGSNRLAYKGRTVHAVKARNLHRHLVGTARKLYEYIPKEYPGEPTFAGRQGHSSNCKTD
jgi:hypothetical protein